MALVRDGLIAVLEHDLKGELTFAHDASAIRRASDFRAIARRICSSLRRRMRAKEDASIASMRRCCAAVSGSGGGGSGQSA